LYLTVAIETKDIPIPLTLVPLRIGTLVYPEIEQVLRKTDDSDGSSNDSDIVQGQDGSSDDVSLKWPNDILIDRKKVCGILMEMEDDYLLIGIGCNVMVAPIIENEGDDSGRQSTCVIDHIHSGFECISTDENQYNFPLTSRIAVG
tara:strand:- start:3288 stop:3725 length:438 start_codon:yes stop_codon:yes gene_type:complete